MLFLDEPSAGLDPQTRLLLAQTVGGLVAFDAIFLGLGLRQFRRKAIG